MSAEVTRRPGRPLGSSSPQRRWSTPDVFRLAGMLEEGWSNDRIAAAFNTTHGAVEGVRRRYGLASRTHHFWSYGRVVRLMGSEYRVRCFLRYGWLRAARGQMRGPFQQWYVRYDDLLAFLEDPAYWHAWHPHDLTDPSLRTWASHERGDAVFLTPEEVAERQHVQYVTVCSWIRKGYLPARRWGVGKGRLYIDSRDLATFELPRIGGQKKEAA